MNDVVVFFDLYDTLIQVNRGYLEKYFDKEIDRLGDLGILKNAKMTIEKIVSKNPSLIKKYSIKEMVKYYEECMDNAIMNVDENILSMLEELTKEGISLCIISDAAFTDIRNWDNSPLSKYFNKKVFSCEIGYVKPDSIIFEKAKEVMGNPKKCIFVGDGGHDELYGAHKVGMETVKVNWFINRRNKKINLYSDYCIKNKKNLKELVKKQI